MRWMVPARVLLLIAITVGCRSSSDNDTAPTTTTPPPALPSTELSTSSTSSPSATPSPSTTVSDPERCRSSQLRATLLPRQGAAGTSFLPIELRNVSGAACTLEGFAGVSLQNRGGQPVVADPARDPGLPPAATGARVRVQPGKSAQFVVAFNNIEPPDGAACPTVSKIAIIPPADTERLVVAVTELLAPCGEPRVGPVTPPQPS